MKILAIGQIRSALAPKEIPNWGSDSPPDKLINGALKIISDNQYYLTDFIAEKNAMRVEDFNKLTNEEKLKLCEENRKNLVKEIEKFNPKYIFILFDKFFKGFPDFLDSLQIEIPIICIYHPSYAARRKHFSVEEYIKHIRGRMKK